MDKIINSRMHFCTVVINTTNLLEPSGKALHIIYQYSPEQILSMLGRRETEGDSHPRVVYFEG